MTSVNFWPILVASVVAFAIGALWYSPVLFGRMWMSLKNLSEKDISESSGKSMWSYYLIQLVATIVLYFVMGFVIAATGSQGAADGLFIAFILWLGFSVTNAVSEMLWNKAPLKLVLIGQANMLLTWLIGGAIIGAWR